MSYYEMMIQQLLNSGSPQYSGEQGTRTAGADASLAEDEMLRYQLGSRRKKGEHENIPGGSYSPWYPGQGMDIMGAEGGFNDIIADFGTDPAGKKKREEERKRWAEIQRGMTPGPAEWIRRMGR